MIGSLTHKNTSTAGQRPKKNLAGKALGKAGLVSLTVLSVCSLSPAGQAGTATLPISAKLVRAIEVTVATSLDFGTLAMTLDRAGQARMSPELNRLIIDNNSSLALAGGNPNVGRLFIKAAALPISVSIEKSVVQLTNGVSTVTVNQFNLRTVNGGQQITITPQAGQDSLTIPVGATLNTRPGQLEGTYIGTTRVFANFQ